MVLIVKRFVKVYSNTAAVPKKYKNLMKSRHVRTFSRPFPTIPAILVREYGLSWDEKIVVFHTKTIPNVRGFSQYRTPFKKVYYGTVRNFAPYLVEVSAKARQKSAKKLLRR